MTAVLRSIPARRVTRLVFRLLGLSLGPDNHLCRHSWFKILILIVSNRRAHGTVKDLEAELPICMGWLIEINDGVNPFQDLPLDHQIPWEVRVKKHHLGLETSLSERPLYPRHKVSTHLLEEQDLDVWDLAAIPSGYVERVGIGFRPAVRRTGAPAAVWVVRAPVVAWWRSRSSTTPILVFVEVSVTTEVAAPAPAVVFPPSSGRIISAGPIVIPRPTRLVATLVTILP